MLVVVEAMFDTNERFQLVYCVGGSLKNLCHFEMLTSSGGSLNADRRRGGG